MTRVRVCSSTKPLTLARASFDISRDQLNISFSLSLSLSPSLSRVEYQKQKRMCEKIAQLTKVVSNLHSETEDAREREKEMEEEHSNTIELCRADAARKVLETHSKWREEANEKERFERIANELEAKTRIMQSGVDEALREIIREAESKSDALNEKMEELEILFKLSEQKEREQKQTIEHTVSETNEKLLKEMELRQSLEEEKSRIERERRAWETKAEHLEEVVESEIDGNKIRRNVE